MKRMKRFFLLLLATFTLQGCIQHTPYRYGYSSYGVVAPAPVRPLPHYEVYRAYAPPVYMPPPPVEYRFYEYSRPQPRYYHRHRHYR